MVVSDLVTKLCVSTLGKVLYLSSIATLACSTYDDVDVETSQSALTLYANSGASLRAAIDQANASAGPDDIILTAPEIVLNSCVDVNSDDDANAVGDLDIIDTQQIRILSSSQPVTITNECDNRLFHVQDNATLRLEKIIIKGGGSSQLASGGAIQVDGSLAAQSLVILNTRAGFGGAIYVGSHNSAILVDSTIEGCRATIRGGAIHANNGSTVELERTAVDTNGSDAINGPGGAIYSVGDFLKITDSSFIDNDSPSTGGAIYAEAKSLQIGGSTFTGNVAGFSGGAVHAEVTELGIESSHFDNNQATTAATSGTVGGGALTLLSDGEFTYTSTIARSSFTNNRATGSAGPRGGAIYAEELHLIVDDTSFVGNSVSGFSGTSGGAGAVMALRSILELVGSIVEGNTSDRKGGALLVERTLLRVDQSTLRGNTATTGSGGALRLGFFTVAFVDESVFKDNQVVGNAANGGAIESLADSEAYIYRSAFEGNFATRSGGAIRSFSNIDVELGDVDFVGNTSAIEGGAIRLASNSSLHASEAYFDGNSSANGGAISSFGSDGLLIRTTVANSTASGVGGGLYLVNSPFNVEVSTLFANESAGVGHSAFVQNGSLHFHYSSIVDDTGTTTGNTLRYEFSEYFFVRSYLQSSSFTCSFSNSTEWATSILNYSNTNLCGMDPALNEVGEPSAFLDTLGDYGGRVPTLYVDAASPIVDGYSSSLCQGAYDQRGVFRAVGSGCDYGAVEYTSAPVGNGGIGDYPTWQEFYNALMNGGGFSNDGVITNPPEAEHTSIKI